MSNKIWKPSAEECAVIKRAAAKESGLRFNRVLLEPGERTNDKNPELNERANIPRGEFNIALITDDPKFADTDLFDYGRWSDFRKGVALTHDGRATVDFYIYARMDSNEELHGNVTVFYAGGRIVRIQGYPDEHAVE